MVCNILTFLDASPMTLFDDKLGGNQDIDGSSSDMFESFLTCVISANDTVRKLAGRVATRLFEKHHGLGTLRGNDKIGSTSLKRGFWRRR
jgi:neurofibromin 1